MTQQTKETPASVVLVGRDNRGEPRQKFADEIAVMSDDTFFNVTERKIWLSAFANNNPRSDYHWQADACYDEAARRGKPDLYKQAWEKASGRAS